MNTPAAARPYIHLLPVQSGELPISWLHRIADRFQVGFPVFSKGYLDGKPRPAGSHDAYPNITLLKRVGALHSSSEIEFVSKHTLLGAMQIFYGPLAWQKLLESMGDEELRGRLASRHQCRKHWHICPKCREAELIGGVPTWQRDAQLPGIRYCGKCGSPLALVTNTNVKTSAPPSPRDLDVALTKPISSPDKEKHHIRLAMDLSTALDRGVPNWGPRKLHTEMFRLIKNGSFSMPEAQGTRITWEKILRQITQVYGDDIFEETDVGHAVSRIRNGTFLRIPQISSFVFLGLLTRTFGLPLAEFLHPVPGANTQKDHADICRFAFPQQPSHS